MNPTPICVYDLGKDAHFYQACHLILTSEDSWADEMICGTQSLWHVAPNPDTSRRPPPHFPQLCDLGHVTISWPQFPQQRNKYNHIT